jgi:phosphomannomutase
LLWEKGMNNVIKFGTDGWRGVIAENYTFENLRMVAQAVADYIDNKGESKEVAIGYDRRFFSEEFARAAAEVLAGNGITVFLSPEACPTPYVSYFVKKKQIPIGIVITASHNNYRYNGFKIKERFGGSAFPDTTRAVEECIGKNPVRQIAFRDAKRQEKIIETPLNEGYYDLLESLVDMSLIRSSNLKIVVDSMNGVCGYDLEHLITSSTCSVKTLRGERDPLFGGLAPEPKEEYLGMLSDSVCSEGAVLGLANDGDGDRTSGVHNDGGFFSPLEMIALLALYMIEEKGMKGLLATNNANTLYLQKIADDHNMKCANTPVGFKYIAELMMKEPLLIGGEESGGMTFQGFLPERDGILIDLLICEMLAKTKKNSRELLRELYDRYGEFHFRRKDFAVEPEKGTRQVKSLAAAPPKELCGRKVVKVDSLDGTKLFLEGGAWILFRQSGTEPALRIYTEMPGIDDLDKVIAQGMKALGEAEQ